MNITKTNFERKSGLWLGTLVFILSLIYIFTTLGKTAWTAWIAIVFGYFLTGFLIIEGGIIEYFRRKEYKKIGIGDFVVWLTVTSSVVVFLNTTLLIQTVRQNAPEWLLSFTSATGVTAGIVAGILGIIYIFSSRFK